MNVIDQHIEDSPRTTGKVQAAIYTAEAEAAIQRDPTIIFRPDELNRYLVRLDDWKDNTVVATSVGGYGYGLNLIRDLLAGSTNMFPTHVAWGTNNTAPTQTDVALYSEQVRNDVIARALSQKRLVIGGFMGTVTGNGNTFVEAALMTGLATVSGVRLFSRVVLNPMPKNTNTVISISWQIDFV